MRFIKIAIIFTSIAILLSACSEPEKGIEVLREETFILENIEYPIADILSYNEMIVDTDQESLVIQLRDNRFVKTDEPNTTIQAQWVNDPKRERENDSEREYDYIRTTVYVSKSDIQKISRVYTKRFEATLEFEELKEEENNQK